MFEYKMVAATVQNCEKTCNELAKEGWRVIAVCPDQLKGIGVIATLERTVESK